MKCHCDSELKVIDKDSQVYECPKCKCRFRFVLVYWQPKCFEKFHKEIKVLKKSKSAVISTKKLK